MTHKRIIYYLFIALLWFGVLQLYPLYAQEDNDNATPQVELQISPDDIGDPAASTENEATNEDVAQPDNADADTDADTDVKDGEISESEIERIMRQMEAKKNRVKEAKLLSYKVINRFPHRPTAFTQGLVIKDDTLIESSGGYGKSSLSKVSLKSGKVLTEETIPPHIFAEGVTYLKDSLYQLSYRRGILMVYDADTLQLNRQHQYSGEGWGLATNGKHLIMSDGSDTLKYMRAKDFTEISRISVTENGRPLKYLNELEWVDGKIYANVWLRNKIVIINPKTGVVGAYLDLKELLAEVRATAKTGVLNGIAYDEQSKRLYVTGKYWPTLFEIEIERKS